MRWLLTTPTSLDLDTVRRELEAVGGALDESETPVPLGEQEQVLYAEGPEDLSEKLAKVPAPIKANPDSELELY